MGENAIDWIQQTDFETPTQSIVTQWGKIFYDDWLEREAARIKVAGAATEIRENSRGRLALFVERDPRTVVWMAPGARKEGLDGR